jgi:hypothetical protein
VHVEYDDGRRDVVDAGDAFYAPAGHTVWRAESGTEMLMFSPTGPLAEVTAAITAAMQRQP